MKILVGMLKDEVIVNVLNMLKRMVALAIIYIIIPIIKQKNIINITLMLVIIPFLNHKVTIVVKNISTLSKRLKSITFFITSFIIFFDCRYIF